LRFRAALQDDGLPSANHVTTAFGSITRSLGCGKVENGIENQAIEGLCKHAVSSRQSGGRLYFKVKEHPCAGDVLAVRRQLSAWAAFGTRWFYLRSRHARAIGRDKKLATGTGRGIAIHFGTIVGEIAEVAVSPKGEIRVERVVCVVDCGHVVNPTTVAMQIESGVIYGLTAALYGEITIRNGRVEQGNFNDYKMVRMAEAPHIETHLALSGGNK
jgi:isoquinoline 1-oxidoreductase subunit beta